VVPQIAQTVYVQFPFTGESSTAVTVNAVSLLGYAATNSMSGFTVPFWVKPPPSTRRPPVHVAVVVFEELELLTDVALTLT
jgi:hypothetical protein